MANKLEITFNKQEPVKLFGLNTLDNKQIFKISNGADVINDLLNNQVEWLEIKSIYGGFSYIRKSEILMLEIFEEEVNE